MILLDINPLSRTTAISEILILLIAVAAVGYLIGYWITKGQLRRLQEVLVIKEGELSDCKAKLEPESRKNSRPTDSSGDDLKRIEGIGPSIEKILHQAEITSFSTLAFTSTKRLKEILRNAGPRFQIHDPESWPQQAALAMEGKWDELEELQDKLLSGRNRSE